MADQWHGGQASSGERWNVNLPAVVGVVFVFLIGVVIWVVASSGDDGGDAIQSVDTGVTTAPTVAPVTTPPPTTTPPPMPSTTPAPAATSAAVPTVAPTAPPATAAPTQPPATQPPATTTTSVAPTSSTTTTSTIPAPDGAGDLGVEGHPIRRPDCDGSYITVIASAVGDDATAAGLGIVLDEYEGSSYLRTDLTCPSLTQSVEGEPVYVVYFGPFNRDSQACAARSDGPDGAYVRRLSRDLDPTHSVACD